MSVFSEMNMPSVCSSVRKSGFRKSILLMLSCLFFLGGSETIRAQESLEDTPLKVLNIGNSYTLDTVKLLPYIAKASTSSLKNMCMYLCFRGNGRFKSWYDIYHDCDSIYTYNVLRVMGGLKCDIKVGTGETCDGSLFRQVLTDEKWDIIIIHPNSISAPYYEIWNEQSNEGYLDSLIAIIRLHQPDVKLGTMVTHSYMSNYSLNKEHSSYLRWEKIADATQAFINDYGIDFVIPYGTAVQNLRSTSLNNEYDLTRDGTHLCFGLGRYTAACCYYEALFAPRSGISVLGNSYRVDTSGNTSNYPAIDVTDENAIFAQEAVVLAMQDMYHVNNPEEYIHKITYIVDGEIYKYMYLVEGMQIDPLEEPVKEGEIFSGWDELPEYMPSHDVTIHGSFGGESVGITKVSMNQNNTAVFSLNGQRLPSLRKGLNIVVQEGKSKKVVMVQ